MTTHDSARATAARAAYWLGIAVAVLTVITFALAITAVPDAGPHCASNCATYPFTSEVIADQFPGDYWWMVPAIVLMLAFVALVAALHELAPPARRVFSLVALVVAALATGTLVIDYFVQLTVLQPSLEKGQLDGWSMLTQYNPNGVFIALEEIGYILAVVSLACLVPTFTQRTRTDRALRWLFLGALLATAIAFAVVTARHGADRQDLFEVPVISIAWVAMLVGGVLVAVRSRRDATPEVAE